MSPQQGTLLLREVAPRLHSAIPNAVSHVGCEDTPELLQDGLAMAAKMLTRANRKGKKVTAGNVAYYTLQHLKSGRRTVGFSSVDVLGSATQLNGRSVVSSIDEDLPLPGEVEGDIPVAELMSRDVEDPATKAARKLDWQEFVASQDRQDRQLIECLAEGCTARESRSQLKLSAGMVRNRLNRLRQSLVAFFGDTLLAEVCRQPQWFHDLRAVKEQFACRCERSWQMQ